MCGECGTLPLPGEMAKVLQVLEIFDSLQGEGYWSGAPMTFVRLAGCNALELGLGCTEWCDTAVSWDWAQGKALSVVEILAQVRMPRLCITGGEPLLQRESLVGLVAETRLRGITVHLETNGTLPPPDCVIDWAVVSPKPPHYELAPGWEGRVQELKLIVDGQLRADIVEALAQLYPDAVVSLQPVWQGPTDWAKKATELVMAHPNWRLSLQIHKILGLK